MTRTQKAILINLFFCLFLNVGYSICSIYYLGDNTEDWIGVLMALFLAACQFFMSFLVLSVYDKMSKDSQTDIKLFVYLLCNLPLPFFFIAIAFMVSLYFTGFTYILAGLYIACSIGYWRTCRWMKKG